VPDPDEEDFSAMPPQTEQAGYSAAHHANVEDGSFHASVSRIAENATTTSRSSESVEADVGDLADKSPVDAAAYSARIEDPAIRRAALEQTAIAWAEKDLSGATNWLSSLPPGETREVVSRDIAYEASRTNAMVALELAADMPANRERDDLIVHAIRQWANEDAASATTWAQQVADEKLKA